MDSPSELTSVFRMKRDFAAFVGEVQRVPGELSYKRRDLKCTLDFDESLSDSYSIPNMLDHERKMQEAERLADKSAIAHLKSQVLSLEAKLKQSSIEAYKKLNLERHEKELNQEMVEELRTDLKLLCENENQLRDKEEEKNVRLSKLESEMCVLRKEKAAADYKRQQSDLDAEEKSRLQKENLFQLKTKLHLCQSELEETKLHLTSTNSQLSVAREQVKEMEQYKHEMDTAKQVVKDLELKIQRIKEDAILMKNLKVQLSKMDDLENEVDMLRIDNTYLRDIQEKTGVMREKLDGYQKKVSRYEQRLVQYTSMEVDYEKAKKQLHQWKTLNGSSVNNPLTPTTVKKTLVDLQNSEAVLLEKDGKLQAVVKTQENSLRQMRVQIHQLETNLATQLANNQRNMELLKSWQKKCTLISKERDGYQNIIQSYDNELTVMNTDSIMRSRVHTLEEMVANLRATMESQETDLKQTKQHLLQAKIKEPVSQQFQSTSLLSSVKAIDQKIEMQLRQKIEELEKNLENVTEAKNILEMRLEERQLQGDYDPSKTKVLHMRINPISLSQQSRQEKFANMQEEIDRLRARVKVLEQAEGQAADVTLQVNKQLQESCNCKEVVEKRSQLEAAELKTKRLIETFKDTSKEVREITYRLTGYRLDITGTNVYKLTSLYAESSEDYLLFQRGPSSELHLLESSFSKTTGKLLELYLKKQGSIPAYLSSITLDLCSRPTDNM